MSSIGQRIYELRSERAPRLTQRELAERAGVSVDLIQKLEQGRKASARITTLTAIARALDVDLSALLGRPTFLESVPEDGGLLALRRAITPVADAGGEHVSTQDLRAALADAWKAYWRGAYDVMAGVLPGVIADARVSGGDILAEAYQIAACMLVHLGHSDLSLIAVSKALATVNDPLLRAALVGTESWVLLNQGRPDDAAITAIREADEIEPRRKTSPQHIAMWGNLLVTGATAVARDGNAEEAQDLLRPTRGAAVRIGENRNDYQTSFGVPQVVMQSVDVAVVDGDYARALDAAGQMPKASGLPLAAKARHMTDLAHAHVKLGRYGEAETIVPGIEQLAPQWIRYQVFPRTVVAEIVNHRRPSPKVRALARRLGVQ
jgi:transcriptional regulator with XRE-family HTH domain